MAMVYIATSKIQNAMLHCQDYLTPAEKAWIDRLLLTAKGTTIGVPIEHAPMRFLKELLATGKLTPGQAKPIFMYVNGTEGSPELLNTILHNPKDAHNAILSLASGKEGPSVEWNIGGRWYPVEIKSEHSSRSAWGMADSICYVDVNAGIPNTEFSKRFYITESWFDDEDGDAISRTLKDILFEMKLRPRESDLSEFTRLYRQALRIQTEYGKVYTATGPGIRDKETDEDNKWWRWFRLPEAVEFGSPLQPQKVVIEGDLEREQDRGGYGYGYGNEKAKFPLPFVRVFSLDLKWYYYVDVRDIEEYKFDSGAMSRLVLPPAMQGILHKVFSSNPERFFGDIIRGKHGGLVVLAEGGTGVGKTLTAEVFSEHTKRPMYVLEMGELGTSLSSVEQNLRKVFLRATRWDAILLFDEADIFLGERGENLERSAIVGVFLRLLDYYRGIFFMTTNRTKVLDKALMSRITLRLSYPDLNRESRDRIWTAMLQSAKIKVEGGLNGIPDLELNGRNIRNLVRLIKILHPGEIDPTTDIEGESSVSAEAVAEICRFNASGGTDDPAGRE